MAVSRRSIAREYFEALLIAVIFALFARTYAVQAFKIPSGSMEENLLIGDHILVNKFVFSPTATALERWLLPIAETRRGDVVVFKYPKNPERDFIKRLIGLPGDTIEIVDKVLHVNGEAVGDASYTYYLDPQVYPASVFFHDTYRYRDNFGPYEVPADHYFFLGDNRDNSDDSRFWGPVPASYLKGRALLIYWSFEADHEPVEWPGYRGRIRQLAHVFFNFFSGTRWERSFRLVR